MPLDPHPSPRKKTAGKSNEVPDDQIVELVEKLKAFPNLREKLSEVLDAADNKAGVEEADAAEELIVGLMRDLGNLTLQTWADNQVTRKVDEFKEAHPEAKDKGKKKLNWTSSVGKIRVVEQVFKLNGSKVRPFLLTAKVRPRGCSGKLERIMVDFGADGPFDEGISKVQEHYGITVTQYAVRKATLKHGEMMLDEQVQTDGMGQEGGVPKLIAEIDGCMLPIVEFNSNSRTKDLRKVRAVSWKETRLSLAHEPGKVMPFFGSTGVGGSTVEAGKQLERCAILAGAGRDTKIHGVGDGASWIAEQFDTIFGTQATYLLDIYHVCDYLAAAARTCAKRPKSWITRQKNKLKRGEVEKVLASLNPHLEQSTVDNEDAPVRACHRYLSNRLGQLDYKSALENDLPIGSGEIESANRHVLQARLKLAGAWWKVDNANKVIALRLNRANGDWGAYWENRRVA